MFHAMFEHDMKEKKNSAVNVEDVESDAMESMLHFIYTGERFLFVILDWYDWFGLRPWPVFGCGLKIVNMLRSSN